MSDMRYHGCRECGSQVAGRERHSRECRSNLDALAAWHARCVSAGRLSHDGVERARATALASRPVLL